ncbi:hypothetical protein COTS27_01166 [Spirochaetota bacterium]|nr:hypothetical protein COTS27_01166 [Spirochaetota bacterium]
MIRKEYITSRIWNYLIAKPVKEKITITYIDLCHYLNKDPNLTGHLAILPQTISLNYLNPILEHCQKNNLPSLTIIIVSQNSGLPSELFFKKLGKASRSTNHKLAFFYKESDKVFNYNWHKEKNPFSLS